MWQLSVAAISTSTITICSGRKDLAGSGEQTLVSSSSTPCQGLPRLLTNEALQIRGRLGSCGQSMQGWAILSPDLLCVNGRQRVNVVTAPTLFTLQVTVAGGRHSFEGWSVVSGFLVVDTSNMTQVSCHESGGNSPS